MDTKTIVQGGKPEAEAVAEIVKRSMEPRVLPIGSEGGESRGILLVPNGVEPKSLKRLLDEYRTAPERRRGTARATDLASFIALVNRFKDPDSAIFADRTAESPSLLAILDYHRPGPDGAPRFGDHRVRYEFPLSDEWKAWRSASGKTMNQHDFAAFIEERLVDVIDGDGAGEAAKRFVELLGCSLATPQKLLELSKGLTVHVDQKLQSHVNLATGEGQLLFAEEHRDVASQPLKVPGAFLLAIPVFRSGETFKVPVKLRYRPVSGHVTWWFDLHRDDAILDFALTEACTKAEDETGLPLYAGIPEKD